MTAGNNGVNNSRSRYDKFVTEELNKLVELQSRSALSRANGLQYADQASRLPSSRLPLQGENFPSRPMPPARKAPQYRRRVDSALPSSEKTSQPPVNPPFCSMIEKELDGMQNTSKLQLNYKFFHEYLLKHFELIKFYDETKVEALKGISDQDQRRNIGKQIHTYKSKARKKCISFLLSRSNNFQDPNFFKQNSEQLIDPSFRDEIVKLSVSLDQTEGYDSTKNGVLKLLKKEAISNEIKKISESPAPAGPLQDNSPVRWITPKISESPAPAGPLQDNSRIRRDILPGIKLKGGNSMYKSPSSRGNGR
jgi:hypothetical protein